MNQLNNQDIEVLLQALDQVPVKGVQSMQAVLLVADKLRKMKAEFARLTDVAEAEIAKEK